MELHARRRAQNARRAAIFERDHSSSPRSTSSNAAASVSAQLLILPYPRSVSGQKAAAEYLPGRIRRSDLFCYARSSPPDYAGPKTATSKKSRTSTSGDLPYLGLLSLIFSADQCAELPLTLALNAPDARLCACRFRWRRAAALALRKRRTPHAARQCVQRGGRRWRS